MKNITIDVPRREVIVGEDQILLTPKEFSVLLLLAKGDGVVVSREEIGQAVWGSRSDLHRTINVSICRLRSKIGRKAIITMPRVGYKSNREAVMLLS